MLFEVLTSGNQHNRIFAGCQLINSSELKALRSLPASPSPTVTPEPDDVANLSLEAWSQELLGL